MRKSLGNIVVKDIKSTLLFRPRLLKSLKLVIENYLFKNRKTYFNAIAVFKAYTSIIKTKGIRPYAEGLATSL